MDDAAKCAHSICKCPVAKDGKCGKCCSEHCRDAEDTDTTEIRCDCKHAPCN